MDYNIRITSCKLEINFILLIKKINTYNPRNLFYGTVIIIIIKLILYKTKQLNLKKNSVIHENWNKGYKTVHWL